MLLNGAAGGTAHEHPLYHIGNLHQSADLARSNTLRSSGSDHSSQNGLTTIYAVGNASGHVNGSQTLMTTPAIGGGRKTATLKSGGTASTIRKIFGSSSQRKVTNERTKAPFDHLSFRFSLRITPMAMDPRSIPRLPVYLQHNV